MTFFEEARIAEVGNAHVRADALLVDEDAAWTKRPMHHAARVGRLQRLENLAHVRDRRLARQMAVPRSAELLERFAGDPIGHDDGAPRITGPARERLRNGGVSDAVHARDLVFPAREGSIADPQKQHVREPGLSFWTDHAVRFGARVVTHGSLDAIVVAHNRTIGERGSTHGRRIIEQPGALPKHSPREG